ncbi:flavoprotein [Streptomyces minutiscleroticus]|uniref:Flavoprotein n=1 Tax=Streptomyces minutiscleroticus TaxID=68238 RepID=A0A918U2M1_9ACTN|nr:flavoprotein [Streptomyces minutiscleroticus]GGX83479.1 flavoprotein [Streptomyces minutiscleroticus]
MTIPSAPNSSGKKPFLYVVVCACDVAGRVGKLITAAQERDWDVGVIATPQGLDFFDPETVEALTGYPVRSSWRTTGRSPLPPPDAIAVAPASFNTVNKWAAGISDTLALGVLCEAYGTYTPTAVLPYVSEAQAAHPAYRRNLKQLSGMGVLIGTYRAHRPDSGGEADSFRWEKALDLLEPKVARMR